MLKKSIFALSLMVLLFPSLPAAGWQGKVIGIKDCRTIIVFDGTNLPVTVLLKGMERTKRCPQEAKQFVAEAVFGKKVEIKDERKAGGDVVAEVIMEDGKSLNKELLRQGFMRHSNQAVPVAASPKPTAAPPPAPGGHESVASPEFAKKSSSQSAGQYRESSAVPGVRKWRDKKGNIHFSGSVGGK
jgi:endonuclease YncB( thermonuclease family)